MIFDLVLIKDFSTERTDCIIYNKNNIRISHCYSIPVDLLIFFVGKLYNKLLAYVLLASRTRIIGSLSFLVFQYSRSWSRIYFRTLCTICYPNILQPFAVALPTYCPSKSNLALYHRQVGVNCCFLLLLACFLPFPSSFCSLRETLLFHDCDSYSMTKAFLPINCPKVIMYQDTTKGYTKPKTNKKLHNLQKK